MRSFRKYIEYDKRKNVNNAMLIFTLLFLSGFLTAGFLYKGGNVTFYGKFLPCPFHTITGLSCPGCGMTRAVYALYDGNIEESLLQNPSIIYFLAIFIIYDISYLAAFIGNLLQRIFVKDEKKRKKLHGLYYSNFIIMVWLIGIGIFAVIRMTFEIFG